MRPAAAVAYQSRATKHAGELSLLPLKVEKVCGKEKREGLLAEIGKNANAFHGKRTARSLEDTFYNRYTDRHTQ